MTSSEQTESTVIVVEDDSSMREALEALLLSADYDCCSHASGEAFLATDLPPPPRCLLLDLQLGGQSGLEVQHKLNARNVSVPIVFVSGDDNVAHAVTAMKAGAMDFVQKPFDPEQLLVRVEQALQASRDGHDHRQNVEREAALLANLTEREREILTLLVDGYLNREIARALEISTRTVESHRTHIMQKLEARTLADLARMWLHNDSPAREPQP